MSDVQQLIDRLIEQVADFAAKNDATLAAAAAEIDRLRAQVQSAALDYLALDQQATEALARATAAEAERDALRAALDALAAAVVLEGLSHAVPNELRNAIAALGGQP